MGSVLITGASSGIGAASARRAGSKGWGVFVGYKDGLQRAEDVAGEIVRAGGRAWPVQVSLPDEASIDAALAFIRRTTGALEAAVLCAGVPPAPLTFAKTDRGPMLDQFQISAGHQRLVALLWKSFFSASGGHVVALSSEAAGRPPWPGFTSYVVAKRALVAALECATAELGKDGLRVSIVSPGYTETPMLLSLHPHRLEAIRAKVGAAGLISPETVATKIAELLDQPPQDASVLIHRLS